MSNVRIEIHVEHRTVFVVFDENVPRIGDHIDNPQGNLVYFVERVRWVASGPRVPGGVNGFGKVILHCREV
jgi:hypothetical protein